MYDCLTDQCMVRFHVSCILTMPRPVLNLSCWNVNGLFRRTENFCKLDDPTFVKAVSDFDVVGLVETHAGPDDSISLAGYKSLSISRPRCNKALKFSGGIAVLIKNRILDGVDTGVQMSDHAVWIKLKRDFFHFEQDIYLGIIYLPPENSLWGRDAIGFFSHLLCQMYIENDVDNIIVCGNTSSSLGLDLEAHV